MNYHHAYHAGSFADVMKHVVLTWLVKSFTAKEKPFCYLDTHAGNGSYDFSSALAQKSQEYQHGIHLLQMQQDAPPLVQDYLTVVKQHNPKAKPGQYWRFYPGSPRLVRSLVKPHDRLMLNELNPNIYSSLVKAFQSDKQVTTSCQNGYHCLKSLLPPPERRGLILIDPAFEVLDEFTQIIIGLKEGLRRFATGVYAIWYPIKNRQQLTGFYKEAATLPAQEILLAELSVYPNDVDQLRLNGCGMMIINPPWQAAEKLKPALTYLWSVLSEQQQGGVRLDWLKRENTSAT